MKPGVLLACCGLLTGLFWVVAAIAGAPLSAGGRTGPDCQSIVYSTNPNYPPYDWAEGEDFDGATIELLKRAMPPGVRVTPLVVPWKRALHLAAEGEIDLLASLRITPERSRYLQFTSHRAFPNPIVLFIRADRAFPYHHWADLKGRLGGVSLGDTFGGGFDEYLHQHLTVEEAPGMEENFRKLAAGRIDYCVTSLYVGQAYLARHPSSHAIIALYPPISDQDIHFAMSKRSPCLRLLEPISAKLKELDDSGVPEALLRQYLRRYSQTDHGTRK